MGAPLVLANGTLLAFSPSSTATPTLTPYGARGITQTFEVIEGGGAGQGQWLRRDVNGVLRDTSDVRFRKYRSTISCRDGETPCLDGSWIGVQVQVSCIFYLSFPTGGTPQRPVVAASAFTQGSVTYYRPQLTMLIASIKNSAQEYAALNSWEIGLEEV
jgi:hypothetical protein